MEIAPSSLEHICHAVREPELLKSGRVCLDTFFPQRFIVVGLLIVVLLTSKNCLAGRDRACGQVNHDVV